MVVKGQKKVITGRAKVIEGRKEYGFEYWSCVAVIGLVVFLFAFVAIMQLAITGETTFSHWNTDVSKFSVREWIGIIVMLPLLLVLIVYGIYYLLFIPKVLIEVTVDRVIIHKPKHQFFHYEIAFASTTVKHRWWSLEGWTIGEVRIITLFLKDGRSVEIRHVCNSVEVVTAIMMLKK